MSPEYTNSSGRSSDPPSNPSNGVSANTENTPPVSTSSSSSATAGPQAAPKRSRVLLSCAACRNSKLKCDRGVPACGQCLKKGRPEACVYAPRPQKQKPVKSMAARLKRLEGMVRGMIDPDGPDGKGGEAAAEEAPPAPPEAGGQVVRGDRATSYVGGTHFMAILEDIDELKSYFEYPEEDEQDASQDPYETAGMPEFLLMSKNVPRNREELLAMLPERSVIDRLMVRYFTSNSPSQHILHKPTFSKEYNKFWQDPSAASLHWIAILFMVTALGVLFSSFQSPHELEADSPISPMDRYKAYRGAASTALIWGKYSQPSITTLQAFLLYVEADFLADRQSQMNCYLLCSVLIRLMLKMGLHRDPSKLPGITPYDGEMRRRTWNLAIQLDLLVSFHLGMPSMIHGIESDTLLPRNLIDADFDQDTKELPLARPSSDYTSLTYPINKAALCRVFGLVARQAHSLTIPSYAEVMKIDAVLEETYKVVPEFMKVKPMKESITDSPMHIVQRIGLANLYQKSRCVLHRMYITDANPKTEHDYSRKTCLRAALDLLGYQRDIYDACKPGAMLNQLGWFVSALAINDFLLADMIIALVIQSEHYSEVGGDYNWTTQGTPSPSKEELLQLLRSSLLIWRQMAIRVPDSLKAAEVVETILKRAETHLGIVSAAATSTGGTSTQAPVDVDSMEWLAIGNNGQGPTPPDQGSGAALANEESPAFFRYPHPKLVHGPTVEAEASCMGMSGGYDWNQFDALARGVADQPEFPVPDQTDQSWLNRDPMDDLDFITSTSWHPAPQG